MEPFTVIAALIFTIPVLALIGGIVGGILKARGRQRLAELVQRERIAAIERGIDPSRLPPAPMLEDEANRLSALVSMNAHLTPTNAQKAQGFLVTGVIMLSLAIGLILMLLFLPDARANGAWAAGLLPLSIGVALLVCAFIVRRSPDQDRKGTPKP